MMQPFDFDFAVIGGGSAGYAAARTAAQAGLRTAVIEGGREIGGLCILRGCMPSKALLASSKRAEAVRTAADFGVHAAFSGMDMRRIQERKRLLVADFAGYRRGQLESGRFTLLRGLAAFSGAHTLQLTAADGGVSSLSARTFLIATGSRIQAPRIPGLLESEAIHSDAFLEAEHLPASVLVLGGGAIALEAASFYAGAGVRVEVLQRSPRLLKEADPDVSEAVASGFRRRGISVHTGVRILRVERTAAGKAVHFEQGGVLRSAVAEEILYALGRTPSVEGLALERCGLGESPGPIATLPTQQTMQAHIFAAGDVCSPLEVVHVAIQQGELAARNAVRLVQGVDEPLEKMDYRLKLSAVFSEPEVAMVGLTLAEAAEASVPVQDATHPFYDHGKSMVDGQLDGFVKLLVHAETREIVGAAVVGPHASELIHEVAVAMHFKGTAADLARIPHFHPTLSEIWTYPAEELA